MYICICKGITEKDIMDASKTATTSLEVMKTLGVASDCGRCLQTAIDKFLELSGETPAAAKNPRRNLKQK